MPIMSWKNINIGMTLRGHLCLQVRKNETQAIWPRSLNWVRENLVQNKLYIIIVPFSSEARLSSYLVKLFYLI